MKVQISLLGFVSIFALIDIAKVAVRILQEARLNVEYLNRLFHGLAAQAVFT